MRIADGTMDEAIEEKYVDRFQEGLMWKYGTDGMSEEEYALVLTAQRRIRQYSVQVSDEKFNLYKLMSSFVSLTLLWLLHWCETATMKTKLNFISISR